VDDAGALHLTIRHVGDHWECTEVIANESFGYGTYAFTVGTEPATFDPEAVLGLFTWDDNATYHYREMDVELSRWENRTTPNARFVLQPWDFTGHLHRFEIPAGTGRTTQEFTWRPGSIAFRSYAGAYTATPPADSIISAWTYTGDDVPPPGAEHARINFWLVYGNPPLDGRDAEVVVEGFRFLG
jgi:hypothetical protein